MACVAEPADLPSEEDDSLIGGSPVGENGYRATLFIAGNCTVAKVGSRQLLTAAHCVAREGGTSASPVRPEFSPGKVFSITGVNDLKNVVEGSFKEVVVERVDMHPAYVAAMVGQTTPVIFNGAPPDVAVITLTGDSAKKLSDIPAAKVDMRPVQPGESVVLQGYGCEQGPTTLDPHPARLKSQKASALPLSAIEQSPILLAPRRVHQAYAMTDVRASAGLCPGDSGGPLFRANGQKTIVGVNAHSIHDLNWHTRLDSVTPFKVGTWLKSLGVATTATKGSRARIETCADLPNPNCLPDE